jgi:hypothetical protein
MRKIGLIALGATALTALACGSGGAASDSSGSTAAGPSEDKPKAVAVGKPARDGKFEFTVQKYRCGVASVGPDMLKEKAQGQFCLITIKVKNIGKESQMLSDSDQKALAADGTQFSANSSAGIAANQNSETFLNDINPGNSVIGVLVFDIPKTAKIATLELHDSAFSDGVTVTLH